MSVIELTIGDFDYGMETGVRLALLWFGVHLTRRHRDYGSYWVLGAYSEWSFFYRYKSWRWQQRRKGDQ